MHEPHGEFPHRPRCACETQRLSSLPKETCCLFIFLEADFPLENLLLSNLCRDRGIQAIPLVSRLSRVSVSGSQAGDDRKWWAVGTLRQQPHWIAESSEDSYQMSNLLISKCCRPIQIINQMICVSAQFVPRVMVTLENRQESLC